MGVQETVEDSAYLTKHHPLEWLSEPTEAFFGETPRFAEIRSRYRLLVLRINLVSWIDHHRRLLELFRQIQEDLVRRSQRFILQRQNRENQQAQESEPETQPTSVEKGSFDVATKQAPKKIFKKQHPCKKEIIYRNLFCKIKAKESIKLGRKDLQKPHLQLKK